MEACTRFPVWRYNKETSRISSVWTHTFTQIICQTSRNFRFDEHNAGEKEEIGIKVHGLCSGLFTQSSGLLSVKSILFVAKIILKVIYSGKANKIWQNLQTFLKLDIYLLSSVKKVWRSRHISVAFSEYMNFISRQDFP